MANPYKKQYEQSQSWNITCLGASLASNKGAAAMFESVASALPKLIGQCRFTLLSTHPTADTVRAQQLSATAVVDLRPLRLAFVEIPAAMIVAVARVMRIPSRLIPRTQVGRILHHSDISIDLAGISFVDTRGFPNLVYNALMTGLPLLHGCKTVKAAQALGPFQKRSTKLLARLILPRLAWIGARGEKTAEHLAELQLDNFDQVADLAFSLPHDDDLPAEVEVLLTQVRRPEKGFILIMPSSVVKSLAERNDIDYVDANVELVRLLIKTLRMPVVLAAHSYERTSTENRMNDRPVMLDIANRLGNEVTTIDADLSAGQLRRLISESSVLITSRFHSMISALSTQTPVMVVGWSHKYREVLKSFDLEKYGVGHDALKNPEELSRRVVEALSESTEIRHKMAFFLPEVQKSSHFNFEKIASILEMS